MSDVVAIGGGLAGLSASMMLARDGHRVTVLERNPAPPPAPAEAWDRWERRGVPQFRGPHGFLPRVRQVLDTELPDVVESIVANGGLRANRMAKMPESLTGGWREGDERFEVVTGRRPMFEAVLAQLAEREPGVEIRRGVAVRGLVARHDAGRAIPHVVRVVTDTGDCIPADLVVDAAGRRSPLADHLAAAGCRRPFEEIADSGYVYYSRHFRSDDGELPAMLASPNQPYESINWVTLPADNGHWAVVLVASARDAAMRRARDPEVWERMARSFPLVAHWLDGGPVSSDVDVIASISDRRRHMWTDDGVPVAAGVVAIGDSWACTNPSVGRGTSIALVHATCLRDTLREGRNDSSVELVERFADATDRAVTPLVQDTMAFNRHRLAQVESQMRGERYDADDQGWNFGMRLAGGSRSDTDLLRAHLDVVSVLRRGIDVASDPTIARKVMASGPPAVLPGPGRAELLELAGATTKVDVLAGV